MWQFWDTEDILGFNIFVANNKEMKEMMDKLIRLQGCHYREVEKEHGYIFLQGEKI